MATEYFLHSNVIGFWFKVVVLFFFLSFFVQEPLCTRDVTENRNGGIVYPASTDRPTRSTPTACTAVCPAHAVAPVKK